MAKRTDPKAPAAAVARAPLAETLALLEQRHGTLEPPSRDPWELLLLESCAYLVDDARRKQTLVRLRERVGDDPAALIASPMGVLSAAIEGGGMQPENRAAKVREAANIALDAGLPQIRAMVREDPDEARAVLERFPGIGRPGAQRILLFAGSLRTLAPESNALRALLRLGWGSEHSSYAASYKSACEAVEPELSSLTRLDAAHLLLRRHGQETCKSSRPLCETCKLQCPSRQAPPFTVARGRSR